jgi:predicted phosphodiesterase
VVTDLLRSGWLIERARSSLYGIWSRTDRGAGGSEPFALRRAQLVEDALRRRGRRPDESLSDRYVPWLVELAGGTASDVPLGPLFLKRLGDWVDAYVAPYLDEAGAELTSLGAEEPSPAGPAELPEPPPFSPLETPTPVLPGPVLFRFAILGDLHMGSGPERDVFSEAAVADINGSGAELTIQLGDLTDTGSEPEWEAASRVLGGLDMPVMTMMGNHDVLTRKDGTISGRELFRRYFGRAPDGAIVQHKGFRFAVLDSVDHSMSPYPPFDLLTGGLAQGPPEAVHRGVLSDPQHEILATIAEPASPPTFVFLHHPPQPFLGFPPIFFGLRDADSGRLHATCDSTNVWGVFAGHTHRNASGTPFGDVPVHEVAIPRDFPHGYALVDVGDWGYAYRFVQLSNHELLRSAAPSAEIQVRYGLGPINARGFVWTRGTRT